MFLEIFLRGSGNFFRNSFLVKKKTPTMAVYLLSCNWCKFGQAERKQDGFVSIQIINLNLALIPHLLVQILLFCFVFSFFLSLHKYLLAGRDIP